MFGNEDFVPVVGVDVTDTVFVLERAVNAVAIELADWELTNQGESWES
jgi:hypothetical protein